MNAIRNRPTETLSGVALAATVYGFLTQVGVSVVVASIASVVVAFGPALVSHVVDLVEAVEHKDLKGIETGVSGIATEVVAAKNVAEGEVSNVESPGRVVPFVPSSQAPTDPSLREKP